MSWRLTIFIILICVISLVLRLYRLAEPNRYYFDEVYHAVTAKAYADNNPAAYDPFAPAPREGTAYDWLHPPLAKLIQALSIKILGDNSLGWRLPSAIFGVALIAAVFVLTNIFFGAKSAIFASLIIAFENLTFVMSRITMNDIFLSFFVVVSFIWTTEYIRFQRVRDLIISCIFLGLAISTKWTGIYAIGVVGSFILWDQIQKKSLSLKFLLLLFIPGVIYLVSYGQFWLQGHNAKQFIDLHKQIWWYQNREDLKHSYGTTALFCAPEGLDAMKTWCPWILDVRPVYFSYEQYGEKAGYIYALGNPLIFWGGIVSISYLIGRLIEERKREIAFLLAGYFVFWLPWVFAPRILFLYHYLPSIPFLAISIGVFLSDIYKSKFKYLAILGLLAIILTFFFFYPITSGYPITPESIEKFMWLKTWR